MELQKVQKKGRMGLKTIMKRQQQIQHNTASLPRIANRK